MTTAIPIPAYALTDNDLYNIRERIVKEAAYRGQFEEHESLALNAIRSEVLRRVTDRANANTEANKA